MSKEKQRTYKNTAILALTSFVNILFSIIKNKFFAIFIGPKGIGTYSLLNDSMNFIGTISSLGLSSSGVQAISEAKTESNLKVRKTYNGFLKIFTIVAITSIIITVFFAEHLSNYLLSNSTLTWPIRIISVGIIFKLITTLQNSLIVAMQRIKMLAKANIYRGGIVSLFSVLLAYLYGNAAIPYIILLFPILSWLISFIQTRKILITLPETSEYENIKQLKPFIIFGLTALYTGVLGQFVNLVAKSSILKEFGVSYLGYYQVAISITALYIGFITSSIVGDYYPRLIEKTKESVTEVNTFVNAQIGISMHLIMPVLLVFLCYSTPIIKLLFSSEFIPAASLISYSVSGTLIQVVSWPIVFVFVANKNNKIYFITESIGSLSHLALILFAIYLSQFELLGFAYTTHYIIYIIMAVFIYLKYFEGEITKDNILSFFINSLIITFIILTRDIIPFFQWWCAPILIGLLFYLGRKEYKLIFKSITSKLQ